MNTMDMIKHLNNWKRNILIFLFILCLTKGLIYWVYILAFVWLTIFSIVNHHQLVNRISFKLGTIVEISVITFLYITYLRPSNIYILVIEGLMIFINLILVLLYWYYEMKKDR